MTSEVVAEVENIIEEGLLTVEQAAKFLNITVGALKDWTKLKENPCPCFRYKTRVLRFDKTEILNWFREQTKVWREPKIEDPEAGLYTEEEDNN
jgi:hypothetical protein